MLKPERWQRAEIHLRLVCFSLSVFPFITPPVHFPPHSPHLFLIPLSSLMCLSACSMMFPITPSVCPVPSYPLFLCCSSSISCLVCFWFWFLFLIWTFLFLCTRAAASRVCVCVCVCVCVWNHQKNINKLLHYYRSHTQNFPDSSSYTVGIWLIRIPPNLTLEIVFFCFF